MDESILKLIQEEWRGRLKGLSPTKAKALVADAYYGLRAEFDGLRGKELSEEAGVSESTACLHVRRWKELRASGDSACAELAKAYGCQSAPQNRPKVSCAIAKPRGGVKGPCKLELFGVWLSQRECELIEEASQAAADFMAKYGKGRRPRTGGAYYAPGTAPAPSQGEWLSEEAAALYCGCGAEELASAARVGAVERRMYMRKSERSYFEYELKTLDRYIEAREAMSIRDSGLSTRQP